MEDVKSVWNSKHDIFKVLQTFWTSALEKIIILFKRRVILQQYVPK